MIIYLLADGNTDITFLLHGQKEYAIIQLRLKVSHRTGGNKYIACMSEGSFQSTPRKNTICSYPFLFISMYSVSLDERIVQIFPKEFSIRFFRSLTWYWTVTKHPAKYPLPQMYGYTHSNNSPECSIKHLKIYIVISILNCFLD